MAERVADAETAEAFLRHLVVSNLSALPAAELVEALNTSGGYNQRLRLALEHSGIRKALVFGLDELESGR